MKTVFIYALNEPCSGPDPTAGRTRYVGKAADPYRRYETHLSNNSRERSHKAKWIRSLLRNGKAPVLEILDEVPESEWAFWECEWIRLYRALGFRLTNTTDGGEGLHGYVFSPEDCEKMSAASLGKKKSEQHRAKMSAARKGIPQSPAAAAALKAANMGNTYWVGRHHSEESLTLMSAAHLGFRHTEESKIKMSKASSGRRHFGNIPSEATRAKLSMANTGKKRSAETCAKIGAIHKGKIVSSETRARQSAAQKARQIREHAKGVL